jgi:MerR family transcriptional regulator/heat shock protein HspR
MRDENTGLYSIGVVARLTGLHEQTIRQYERLGLVTPQRSDGGTRVFSDGDVKRLLSIISLTKELGVNLAGVDIILRMRDRQEQLIGLMQEVLTQLDDATRARLLSYMRGDEPGLIPVGRRHLAVSRREPERPKKRRIEIDDGEE